MSKYQQFFLYALMLTLLVGCEVIPQEVAVPEGTDSSLYQCENKLLLLKQDKEELKAELGLAKKQLKNLQAERDQLSAKIDALTAIERSLHERKQRQSNEL